MQVIFCRKYGQTLIFPRFLRNFAYYKQTKRIKDYYIESNSRACFMTKVKQLKLSVFEQVCSCF